MSVSSRSIWGGDIRSYPHNWYKDESFEAIRWFFFTCCGFKSRAPEAGCNVFIWIFLFLKDHI